jgi:hypothetical protein
VTACPKCGTELQGEHEVVRPVGKRMPIHTPERCLTTQLARVTAERDEARNWLAELRHDLNELIRCDYGPEGCMWEGTGGNAIQHLREHLRDLATTYSSKEPELILDTRKQLAKVTAQRDHWKEAAEMHGDKCVPFVEAAEIAEARAERYREALKRVVNVRSAQGSVSIASQALAADPSELSKENIK